MKTLIVYIKKEKKKIDWFRFASYHRLYLIFSKWNKTLRVLVRINRRRINLSILLFFFLISVHHFSLTVSSSFLFFPTLILFWCIYYSVGRNFLSIIMATNSRELRVNFTILFFVWFFGWFLFQLQKCLRCSFYEESFFFFFFCSNC